MGNITACGLISRIYSAAVTTDSFIEKIYQSCEVNRPVRLNILSVASFTSGMWIWIFCKGIYVQQCKRYPLLFSGPKDNNDFSHCSCMNSPLLPPPTPPFSLVLCRYQIYVHSRSTNKGMNFRRCLFARFFFITINFIIIETLLVKTTCN